MRKSAERLAAPVFHETSLEALSESKLVPFCPRDCQYHVAADATRIVAAIAPATSQTVRSD
jgi:hypothetical protein